MPPSPQAIASLLHLAPGLIAARRRAPRAAVALDGAERGLRAARALPLDEVGNGEPREALRQVPQAATIAAAVGRHVQGRRGPEDLLDDAGLHANHGAVRQERVDDGPMAANGV